MTTAVRPYEAVLLAPLWSLTVHTARRAVRGRTAPDPVPPRLLAGAVAGFTLSVTVGVPAVRRAIDAATGVRSVTALLGHLLGLAAITCLTAFVRRMSAPPGTAPRRPGPRRRVVRPEDGRGGVRRVLAACRAGATSRTRAGVGTAVALRRRLPLPLATAALCTAFLLAPRPSGDQDFLTTGRSPAHVVFWGVFLGYVLWGVTAVAVMCLRHHRQAPPGPLRTSLSLLGAGAATAVVYAVHRGAHLLLRDSGIPLFADAVVVPTTQLLLSASLLLSVAGLAWPSLAEARRVRAERRRVRRLEPLWRLLGEAVPEVVLPLPAGLRDDAGLVRYRYVIEISDALLALAPLRSGAVEAAARERLAALGFSGARLAAATEAVVLRCAIDRAGPAGPGQQRPSSPGPAADGDPLGWLELLAAQCRHPHVRTVSAALATAARDP
ncbi:MAB_1171c family putative transporter [Streptomyces griseosporeus]|uniref:MAB_1171c family putative transporter n=1 Tax=Streptomyces griseosporeus TaxID=1910 RepID=UPI0036F6D10D